MNIFQQAAKIGLTFSSPSGPLTVAQLYDLPLTSRTKAISLDSISADLLKRMEAEPRVSLVASSPRSAEGATNELRVEILKAVIADKQAEQANAVNEEVRRTEKEQLRQALQERKNADLQNLTVAELEARLAALGG